MLAGQNACMARNIPEQIREIAFTYPELTEGTSCSKVAFKVKGKSFVFVEQKDGEWNAMMRLGDSIPEAELMAKESPDNVSIGKHGWTTLRFKNGKGPTKKILKRWIDESFRILAPRKVLAEMDAT